jgi:2-amino-4-hydroxy-6-hydroxymethyldihydropteridine diphosphokinase
MAIAYIGIGSNLGKREENCKRAIALLSDRGVREIRRSSFYETEPWGIKEQPRFINIVVEVETGLLPEELLKTLQAVEKKIGRRKTERWGPRIVDLDVLLYNDVIMHTHNLQIPHPYIHERGFVLKPLSEIAPDTIHPVLKKSMKKLLAELSRSQP